MSEYKTKNEFLDDCLKVCDLILTAPTFDQIEEALDLAKRMFALGGGAPDYVKDKVWKVAQTEYLIREVAEKVTEDFCSRECLEEMFEDGLSDTDEPSDLSIDADEN